MFENEILDEVFLKELIQSELEIDIDDIEPASEFGDGEGSSIVGTFANPHEATLFLRILQRMGIPAKLDVDSTMGNMDPLFNTGTQILMTREKDVEQSLKIIEAVDRNIEKYRKEKGSTDYSKFLFAAIVIAVVSLVIMWLILS